MIAIRPVGLRSPYIGRDGFPLAVPPPTVYPDLLSALIAFLQNEPTVAAVLTGGNGPQIYEQIAPAGTNTPFLLVGNYREPRAGLSIDCYSADLQVDIRSSSLDQAMSIGQIVRNAIEHPANNPNSIGRAPFVFAGGTELCMFEESGQSQSRPMRLANASRNGTYAYSQLLDYRFDYEPTQ